MKRLVVIITLLCNVALGNEACTTVFFYLDDPQAQQAYFAKNQMTSAEAKELYSFLEQKFGSTNDFRQVFGLLIIRQDLVTREFIADFSQIKDPHELVLIQALLRVEDFRPSHPIFR